MAIFWGWGVYLLKAEPKGIYSKTVTGVMTVTA